MGLTEGVLAICEAVVDKAAKYEFEDKIDYESQKYYDWLVEESNCLADFVFSGIDSAIDNYFDIGNFCLNNKPPFKDD